MRGLLIFGMLTVFGSGALAASAPLVERYIPSDVLADLARLDESQRAKVCQGDVATRQQFLGLKPQAKLTGNTSQMLNSAAVNVNLGLFGTDLSEIVTAAFVRGDDAQKAIAIKGLARWAEAGAYLQTPNCDKTYCPPAWQTHRGEESSIQKDYDTVLERLTPAIFAYYVFLRDFKPVELASEHKAIDAWLRQLHGRIFQSSRSASNPTIEFGFVLNYQPLANLVLDLVDRGDNAFKARLDKVAAGLDKLVLADGSLKKRTVRGARALWYHYATLNELFFGLELLQANGFDPYPKYADRIEKAVKIFLDADDDLLAGRNTEDNPSSIYRWAKADFHSADDPKVQVFNPRLDREGFTSWLYIYLYRFPNGDGAARIRNVISRMPSMSDQDMGLGFAAGCLYRLKDPKLLAREEASREAVSEDDYLRIALAPPDAPVVVKPLAYSSVITSPNGGQATMDGFSLFASVTYGDEPPRSITGQIYLDYGRTSKKASEISLFRLVLNPLLNPYAFKDRESQDAKYEGCGEMAYQPGSVRLHYGPPSVMNECIFQQMSPRDREFWTAVYQKLPEMIHEAALKGDQTAVKLDTLIQSAMNTKG